MFLFVLVVKKPAGCWVETSHERPGKLPFNINNIVVVHRTSIRLDKSLVRLPPQVLLAAADATPAGVL